MRGDYWEPFQIISPEFWRGALQDVQMSQMTPLWFKALSAASADAQRSAEQYQHPLKAENENLDGKESCM